MSIDRDKQEGDVVKKAYSFNETGGMKTALSMNPHRPTILCAALHSQGRIYDTSRDLNPKFSTNMG
jgi:hypothetical protein